MIRDGDELLRRIRRIHEAIRDEVVATCERQATEDVSRIVAEDEAGDTVFAIDRVSEEVLLDRFAALAKEWPLTLVAEGLTDGGVVALSAAAGSDDAVRVIVDPIDGTRGLMYQKRPAWILTGVAPDRGPATTLRDIELAIMTEIPLVRQHLCDVLWATVGGGTHGERFNRLTGERLPLTSRPSNAETIAQGYGGLARFFPGGRDVLAAVDDEVVARLLGPPVKGKAAAFEDQYIATGGQIYEILMGHDRWIADLRPLLEPVLAQRGHALGLCCHPYDLCTELVAREAGIIVTDEYGLPLSAPLDVISDVSWIGYANSHIHDQVSPVLAEVMREHSLLHGGGSYVAP